MIGVSIVYSELFQGFFRPGAALIRGQTVPFDGFRRVLFDAFSLVVAFSNLVLRKIVALFRSLAIPFCRLVVILFDAHALPIEDAHERPRLQIALFRRQFVVFDRRFVISRPVGGLARLEFRMPRLPEHPIRGDPRDSQNDRDT